jgi:type IV pilus assembly protein PilY1
VNPSTGAVTYKYLDTGVGSASKPNGIAYVASADLDNDHVVDYLYAGDLKGNVWRFNLTSSNPADWGVSKFGNTNPTPLFTTPAGQPITTAVAVASTKTGTVNRIMVLFGTGQKTPATSLAGDTYATGQQAFYGIWDWDMNDWDNGVRTASRVRIPASIKQYASLSPVRSIRLTALLSQSLASTSVAGGGGQVLGYRSISAQNKVCWEGSTTCASGNTQFGWYFNLPTSQEQIIYNPVIIGSAVVVNTAIPPVISANECNPGIQTGWTMALDISYGGGLPQGFLPNANGSYTPAADGSTVAGIQLNGVGSPYVVMVNNVPYLVTNTSSGNAAVSQINPQNGGIPSRVSWRELVNQ